MADKQLKIDHGNIVIKCGIATVVGSLISAWAFVVWDYFYTIQIQGYYSAPLSVLEISFLCIPLCGYQFPVYLISSLFNAHLIKRGFLKSLNIAYLGAGITSWLAGSLLLIISGTGDTFADMFEMFVSGLPSLLLYLWFLYPKPVE